MNRQYRIVTLFVFASIAILMAVCASTADSSTGTVDLGSIDISAVNAGIGEPSPIPLEAIAAGTWPDLCSQVAEIKQSVTWNRFGISVLPSSAKADCPPDHVGPAFRLTIPLNMVEIPAGAYQVEVNEVQGGFNWS